MKEIVERNLLLLSRVRLSWMNLFKRLSQNTLVYFNLITCFRDIAMTINLKLSQYISSLKQRIIISLN